MALEILGRGVSGDGYSLKLLGDEGYEWEIVKALNESTVLTEARWDKEAGLYEFAWSGPPLLNAGLVWSEANQVIDGFSLRLEREASARKN
jgi:hypothetical protein